MQMACESVSSCGVAWLMYRPEIAGAQYGAKVAVHDKHAGPSTVVSVDGGDGHCDVALRVQWHKGGLVHLQHVLWSRVQTDECGGVSATTIKNLRANCERQMGCLRQTCSNASSSC